MFWITLLSLCICKKRIMNKNKLLVLKKWKKSVRPLSGKKSLLSLWWLDMSYLVKFSLIALFRTMNEWQCFLFLKCELKQLLLVNKMFMCSLVRYWVKLLKRNSLSPHTYVYYSLSLFSTYAHVCLYLQPTN